MIRAGPSIRRGSLGGLIKLAPRRATLAPTLGAPKAREQWRPALCSGQIGGRRLHHRAHLDTTGSACVCVRLAGDKRAAWRASGDVHVCLGRRCQWSRVTPWLANVCRSLFSLSMLFDALGLASSGRPNLCALGHSCVREPRLARRSQSSLRQIELNSSQFVVVVVSFGLTLPAKTRTQRPTR